MPAPPTLKIIEVFASVQGEGMRQGEPTVFVRLAGCDRRCSFCDTQYAWEGGRDWNLDRILNKVRTLRLSRPARWVCLTGGEPFMQDTRRLITGLRKDGWKVQVETNGTRYYPTAADWLTVSPKPKDYLVRTEFGRRANEVKLIATRELNLEVIRRMRRFFQKGIPILIQPESNRRWSRELALRLLGRAAAAGLEDIRVSVQLHKVFGLR